MMKKVFTLSLIALSYLYSQNSEQQLVQRIFASDGDSSKLALIEKYISEYPGGRLLANVYGLRFSLLLTQQKDSAAFYSLRKHLSLIPPERVAVSLSRFTVEFAQRGVYLDTALTFIDSAIVLHQNQNAQNDPGLFHTKAFVFYQQKHYEEAEKLQQEAMRLLPENSQFDRRYAVFHAQLGFIKLETQNSLFGVALLVSVNVVSPAQGIPPAKIDSLLKVAGVKDADIALYRDSLYRTSIQQYLQVVDDTLMVKSNIAIGLVRYKVLTDLAEKFVTESYDLTRDRDIEVRAGAAASRGLVCFFLKKYPEAEKYLDEATSYATPNEAELFLALGEVKEELGKKEEALKAYLTAALGSNSDLVAQKLLQFKNELYPTLTLDSLLLAHQASLLAYKPLEYARTIQKSRKNEFPRIVLAELFTGSECRPCQAADYAFDYLRQRYALNTLAILEYHLNIPLPDPMNNDDAEKRSEYYGVNSTPTAIFGGTTVLTSGGNKLAAKNKYLTYSDIIERQLRSPATVNIKLTATMKKEVISLAANVTSTAKNQKLRLRIALVEEEVFYKGANEVSHHKYVVRKMIKSVEGFAIPSNGKLSVRQKVSLKEVEKELKSYLDRKELLFSISGTKFSEKNYNINKSKLSVVAFVQNDKTKEALQAAIVKISP